MYDPLDKYLEKPLVEIKKKKKRKVDPNAPKVKKLKAISIVDHDNVPQLATKKIDVDDDAPIIVGEDNGPTEVRARVNTGNSGGWVDIKLDVETEEEAPLVLLTADASQLIKQQHVKEMKEQTKNYKTEPTKSPSPAPIQQGEISPPRRRRQSRSPSPPRRRRQSRSPSPPRRRRQSRSPSPPRRRRQSRSPRRRREPSPKKPTNERSPRDNQHKDKEKNMEIKIKKEHISPPRERDEKIDTITPLKQEKK